MKVGGANIKRIREGNKVERRRKTKTEISGDDYVTNYAIENRLPLCGYMFYEVY